MRRWTAGRLVRLWLRRAGLGIALLVSVGFALFPVYYMALTSLKPNGILLAQPPVFWFRPVLDHYADLLLTGDFAGYWLNSVIVAVAATACAVFLGALMAFALARVGFRLKGMAFFLVLLPRTFPPVTTIIPIFIVVRLLGMMDHVSTLVLFETAARLPLIVWVLRGFFREMPAELIEAALIDGCTLLQGFFRIALPLAAPGLAAVGIITFIDTWNAFLVPLVLTNFDAITAPVGMMSYINNDEQVVWGTVAAAGMLTILPILLLAFGLNRFLLRGLTAGALK